MQYSWTKQPNLKAGLRICFTVCFLSAAIHCQAASQATQQFEIVDCLLPEKTTTNKNATGAAKIPAAECEAQKGKYVSSEKANYATALKVWEPVALRGDARAQYYVGEIYEKGMGKQPDHKLAAMWYLLAAEQGYPPAQMTIGRMYETGTGVEKNLTKAMNWYRKAAGIEQENTDYQKVFNEQSSDHESLNTTTTETSSHKQELEKLNEEVINTQKQLEESELLAEKLNREARRITIKIKRLSSPIKRNSTLIKKKSVPIKGLKKPKKKSKPPINKDIKVELVKDEMELENQQARNVTLKTELTMAKAEIGAESFLQEKVLQAQTELKQEKDSVLVFKQRLIAVNQALSETPVDQQLQIYQDYLENELKLLADNTGLDKADQNQQNLIQQLIDEIKQRNTSTDTLTEKEDFYQTQLSLLTTNLNEKEKTLALLSERLKKSQQKSLDTDAYIAQLEKQVSESQKQLTEQRNKVIEKQDKLSVAEQQIAKLSENIEKSMVTEDVDNLKAELEQKEQALALAKSESDKLLDNLKRLEERKKELTAQVASLTPKDEPVVAIRWPEYQQVEGVYQSVVATGSVINVVGAVQPHQFIKELTINGKLQEFDENGLFLTAVEVANDPVYLEMIATTTNGLSSKELLVLEPDSTLTIQHASIKSDSLPQVDFGKYYALVIGNSNYDEKSGWQKLDTTVNDAQAVSELLTKNYGFEVITKIDADRDTLLLALENIRRKLTEHDNLLIYYAGHGYVDPENDQGYWIPVDGSVESSVKWISNSTITDQIRAMTARNVMVVADSCYSSTLMRSGLVSLRSGLSLHKKLERLSNDIKAITRVALSAGGLQPVADSIDNSGHSVFANAFLSVLDQTETIIDSDSLATQVVFTVSTATKDTIRQVPRYAPLARGGHQGGDFYFVPKNWKQSDI